ncbi:hypothetical protein J5226_08575 [Lysobacter sp. K5869]|uniref:hypothetical protein n=1 Tax=Lysobacter sp. K5869 TaxID=2820808 RepID=UPI001C05FC1C|nr:hypothetical protein [Lysobacter sp. K5869]QWP78431.1 hypothetical protein J5226_08575 [Lysobacter sp. K5869]
MTVAGAVALAAARAMRVAAFAPGAFGSAARCGGSRRADAPAASTRRRSFAPESFDPGDAIAEPGAS